MKMAIFTKKVVEKTEVELLADNVYAEIAAMPHFVRVEDISTTGYEDIPSSGQLNMLNGCLVSVVKRGLQLTWQGRGQYAPEHSARLADVGAINKFVALMRQQAGAR